MDKSEAALRLAEAALREARRALKELAQIKVVKGDPGEKGERGEPGRDGISFQRMKHEPEDGGRFLVTRWFDQNGEVLHEERVQTAYQIYRGLYKEGVEYQQGDCVTLSGSTWHCDMPTREQPRERTGQKGAWTLQTKRGQNGRDGKDGERGPPGAKGDPGRDLTQLGPDGKKW